MDLSGKLIIKARIGDDIRRIPIHNEDLTYDELVLMMQRVFRGTVDSTDDLLIKYADEDGDLITIFDDSDINYAIQINRILKLTILVKGSEGKSAVTGTVIEDFRKKLILLRNEVNAMLDSLELSPKSTDECPEGSTNKITSSVDDNVPTSAPISAANFSTSFDPLNSETPSVAGDTASIGGGSVKSNNALVVSQPATLEPTDVLQVQPPPVQQPEPAAPVLSAPTAANAFANVPSSNTGFLDDNSFVVGSQAPTPQTDTQATPATMQTAVTNTGYNQQQTQQQQVPYSMSAAPETSTTTEQPSQPPSTCSTQPGMQQQAPTNQYNSYYQSSGPRGMVPAAYNQPQMPQQNAYSQPQPVNNYAQQQQQPPQQPAPAYTQQQPQPTPYAQQPQVPPNSYAQPPQQSQTPTTYAQQPATPAGYNQPPSTNFNQAPPQQAGYRAPTMPPMNRNAPPNQNPHRLFARRTPGQYRMRQPGPGYQ